MNDYPERCARVFQKALSIFGSMDEVNEWLSSPNPFLNDESPEDLLLTSEGTVQIENYLDKIEHNVYV